MSFTHQLKPHDTLWCQSNSSFSALTEEPRPRSFELCASWWDTQHAWSFCKFKHCIVWFETFVENRFGCVLFWFHFEAQTLQCLICSRYVHFFPHKCPSIIGMFFHSNRSQTIWRETKSWNCSLTLIDVWLKCIWGSELTLPPSLHSERHPH